jgi:hypothetical protein
METFLSADILELWERGAERPPFAQALLLLAAAQPGEPADSLAGWSLGRRDAALLALRERLFGDRLVAAAGCPRCGEQSELNFRTGDIRAGFADGDLPPRPVTAADGSAYAVRLRPLTTRDLIELASGTGADGDAPIRRLVVSAERDGRPVPAGELPAEVLVDCAEALAEADPQADVRLALRCPECGLAWEAPFDVAAYLWQEVETLAGRLLREVHLLASAYGWSEAEILRLSPLRRQRYLELVVG